jgi:hypothetical protein
MVLCLDLDPLSSRHDAKAANVLLGPALGSSHLGSSRLGFGVLKLPLVTDGLPQREVRFPT